MSVFALQRGASPLIVSMPHSGTALSPGLKARLAPAALSLADTDWGVPELYDFLGALDASILCATYSRYVIDLNRDPAGVSLYPGQTTTGLVPTESFDGEPLYIAGAEPDPAEIDARRATYFDPYHAALRALVEETLDREGWVLLWDAHSISSVSPRLFEGELPALNLGSYDGRSCAGPVDEMGFIGDSQQGLNAAGVKPQQIVKCEHQGANTFCRR